MQERRIFNRCALNDAMLRGAYEVATNWVVITGAPSSGKSTLLTDLAARGYLCLPETARVYIERQLTLGRTLIEIRADEASFQQGLIEAKLKAEAAVTPDSKAFLDRAMPDSITYYRVAGLDPNQVLKDCFRFRYKKVFLLDRLPFAEDHTRTEDEETSAFLDIWLEHDYRALGYEVIRVPAMGISERVALILESVLAM